MGSDEVEFPGTDQHQAVLQAICSHYTHDARVRAVVVFGSLGRGNWDAVSDIDLDIVVSDDAIVDPVSEWERLRPALDAIDESVALLIPASNDAVDVILASLLDLSVRYHPLSTTSPNIIDSMLVLCGSLGADEIVAAGVARAREPQTTIEDVLATCIRHALYVDKSLARNRLWSASYALHRLRMELMNAFGQTHGGVRGWITFEEHATPPLQARLAETVALHDEPSIRSALLRSIDILEHEIAAFVAGHSGINADGRDVVRRLRERVTARA